MLSLPELQAQFGAALLSAGGSPGMRAYRGNVFGNWGKALAGAYPIVRKIVGAEFFEGLARQFALACPSTSGDLNEFGGELARFVGTFPHTLDLPYLPDVARMEWLAHRAYYAADAAPFDFKAALPGNPRFQLAPPCALLASRWPLGRIWQVHQDDYAGPVDVDLASRPDRIVVHRPRWRVEVRSVAPGDFRFLEAVQAGTMLDAALEAAIVADPAFDASLALARWVDAGVLTR
jgi:uncharacterized protein